MLDTLELQFPLYKVDLLLLNMYSLPELNNR